MRDRQAQAALPFDLQEATKAAESRRAAIAASYLSLTDELGQLVDRLFDLHGDLADDDALHQSLHALVFVWQYFEQELHIVARAGRQ
jgi:hypothetical protein